MKIPPIKTYSFQENWKYQEQYYPQVKSIIEQNAIVFIKIDIADEETDMNRATDFVVKVEGGDIAVRIRRAEQPYRDLTIRSYNNGHKTELQKIKEGFGRYYLYCWEGQDRQISEWILVDLNKLRESGLLETNTEIPNIDNRTKFIAITAPILYAADCIIADHWLIVQASLPGML